MNEEKRTTTANALIWFGAAVSIAEIYTGTLMAPLGMARGMGAVVAGHLIGGFLMYLAALIGGLSGRGAMESVKLSFGEQGAKFFAALNVLQLVGWTAVMIAGGAISLGLILNPVFGTDNMLWCGVIGIMIAVWILLDMKNFERVNKIAMGALFILTLVLSFIVFKRGETEAARGVMSFADAMELSVAMPLSWLPLISDYMRDAREPKKSAAVSTAVYSLTSCWMYFIGRLRYRENHARCRARCRGRGDRSLLHRDDDLSRRLFRRHQLPRHIQRDQGKGRRRRRLLYRHDDRHFRALRQLREPALSHLLRLRADGGGDGDRLFYLEEELRREAALAEEFDPLGRRLRALPVSYDRRQSRGRDAAGDRRDRRADMAGRQTDT